MDSRVGPKTCKYWIKYVRLISKTGFNKKVSRCKDTVENQRVRKSCQQGSLNYN
jgi:hypothetical protein